MTVALLIDITFALLMKLEDLSKTMKRFRWLCSLA